MAKKEIIVSGSIGNTDRQNRDGMRIIPPVLHLRTESAYRQGSSAGYQKDKKIIVAGDISPESKHQWSVTYGRYGAARTLQGRDWKYPICVVRRYEKNFGKRSNG